MKNRLTAVRAIRVGQGDKTKLGGKPILPWTETEIITIDTSINITELRANIMILIK